MAGKLKMTGKLLLLAALTLALAACSAKAGKPYELEAGGFKFTLTGDFAPLTEPSPDTAATLTEQAAHGAPEWKGLEVKGEIKPLIAEVELQLKKAGYYRMQPQGDPTMSASIFGGGELVVSCAYQRTADKSGFIIPYWDFRKADFSMMGRKKDQKFVDYFKAHPVGMMVIPVKNAEN